MISALFLLISSHSITSLIMRLVRRVDASVLYQIVPILGYHRSLFDLACQSLGLQLYPRSSWHNLGGSKHPPILGASLHWCHCPCALFGFLYNPKTYAFEDLSFSLRLDSGLVKIYLWGPVDHEKFLTAGDVQLNRKDSSAYADNRDRLLPLKWFVTYTRLSPPKKVYLRFLVYYSVLYANRRHWKHLNTL